MAELFNWLVRARDGYFAMPPLKFEATTFGLTVLIGLLVMPALIYLAGTSDSCRMRMAAVLAVFRFL